MGVQLPPRARLTAGPSGSAVRFFVVWWWRARADKMLLEGAATGCSGPGWRGCEGGPERPGRPGQRGWRGRRGWPGAARAARVPKTSVAPVGGRCTRWGTLHPLGGRCTRSEGVSCIPIGCSAGVNEAHRGRAPKVARKARGRRSRDDHPERRCSTVVGNSLGRVGAMSAGQALELPSVVLLLFG